MRHNGSCSLAGQLVAEALPFGTLLFPKVEANYFQLFVDLLFCSFFLT